ncbi:hypothetical protein M8494_23210 [Serratia ureilytica]
MDQNIQRAELRDGRPRVACSRPRDPAARCARSIARRRPARCAPLGYQVLIGSPHQPDPCQVTSDYTRATVKQRACA